MDAALLIFILVVLVNIAIFLFWFFCFVDCLRRKNFPDKIVWVIVLLFTYLLGAILYLILVKCKESKPESQINKGF